ncbi:MAG: hypothetical protein R3C61_18560, partial [Bacteroidia bacterium]
MKQKIFSLFFAGILLGCSPGTKSPLAQLQDVVIALNEAPSFEYHAFYDIKQDGATLKDTTSVFIEKSSGQGLLPVKYIFESASGEMQLFDGQRFNTIINTERTIIHTENPPAYLIVSNQGLLFSPFYIQSYLTYLLENDQDAINYRGDTLVN